MPSAGVILSPATIFSPIFCSSVLLIVGSKVSIDADAIIEKNIWAKLQAYKRKSPAFRQDFFYVKTIL
jgi:hypothetical protein